MHNFQEHHVSHEVAHGTIRSYIAGFSLSVLLTIAAFLFVDGHVWSGHYLFSHTLLYFVILACALTQLFVQLFFFFHFGKGSSACWNLTVLAYALVMVIVLVGGTLWIMHNLQHGSIDDMFHNGEISPQNEED